MHPDETTAAGGRWLHSRGRGWGAPSLVLLAGLGLTLLGVAGLWGLGRSEDRRRFERECEEMWRSLQPRLASIENWMIATRDFCARHVDRSPEHFSRQWRDGVIGVHRLRDYLPGLYELGYAELEASGEASLWNFTNQLQLPPGARVIVRERWLLGGRPALTGDDLYAGDQAPSIRLTWETGKVLTTGRVDFPRSASDLPRRGFRLFVPLYHAEHNKHAPKPRAVIFASFLPSVLLRHHFGDEPRAVECELYAGSNPATRVWLSEPIKGGAPDRAVAPDAARPLRHTLVRTVFGATWSIDFRSTVLFAPSMSPRLLAGIGAAGVVFSLLMCLAVRLQVLRRLEAESAQALQALAEAKVRREAEERTRLVRDLHERTIQSLLAVNAHLVRCAGLAESAQPEALREELETAASDLDAAVGEVRDSILRIGPATETEVPFSRAITDWLARLNRGRGASLVYEADEAVAERLSVRLRAELTAIIREAVSNALRHGQALRVIVTLREEAGQGELTVHDDGVGFAPAEAPAGGGLGHLRQRARDLEGECRLESRPGGPTTLRVRFPLPAAAPAALLLA